MPKNVRDPKVAMTFRIQKANFDRLKAFAEKGGSTLSALADRAVAELLDRLSVPELENLAPVEKKLGGFQIDSQDITRAAPLVEKLGRVPLVFLVDLVKVQRRNAEEIPPESC